VKKGLIRRIAPINISAQDARANLTRYAHLLTGLTTVLDFGNLTVMPGVLDTHVHQNEPGRADWEGAGPLLAAAAPGQRRRSRRPDEQRAAAGFRSASRAAAAGGVTTFVDMPLNNDPATTTAALLGAKRRASKVPTPPHFGQIVQGSATAEQGSPVHEWNTAIYAGSVRACRPCCNRPCAPTESLTMLVQAATVATCLGFFVRGVKPSHVQV